LRSKSRVNQRVFSAGRTFFWHGGGVPAKMTAQPRHMSMEGESYAAIGTVARLAAIAAKQRRGETAPIQKQNRLLAFLESVRDRLTQFLGQDRQCLFFAALLAKIDNPHERHSLIVDALGQRKEFIFAGCRVVITFERRRSAPQHHGALLDL